MVRAIFNMSSPRKRTFLLKCLILSMICLGFLTIWWRRPRQVIVAQQSEHSELRGYEKAELPFVEGVRHARTIDDTSYEKMRLVAEKENMDEFLIPVLENFKYTEVDLWSRGNENQPNNDYDEEIREDLNSVIAGLGEKGEIAKVPEFQTAVADEILKKEAFNRLLSDMISPNRSVPDTREPSCLKVRYDQDLPSASVVIIYTDEAYSSLIRTLHSIVNRTPKNLLKEIILVDDFSSKRDLRGKLERYLATNFERGKIRLLRLAKRSGLIRARMIGAHVAIGDVLVFLDAHIETIEKWMEPLLQRIKEERTAVVCPIIDVIDDKTLEYSHGNGNFFQIGGFTWSGHFTWINIPKHESDRKKSHHDPTRSPTMAGGLFAIDRKYFWEVGSYDSDMQLWGGENLEMSFRVWQCGGSIEIIPCSRVGHIFRSFHPYSFPGNVDSHGLNTARLVEVWLDDYKDIFYLHRQELKTSDIGDVSKRLRLREKLKCKDFTWYLDNVYREKFRLWFGSKYYGQIKNNATSRCLDNMAHSSSEEYQLSVYPCHPQLFPSQTFFISNESELRRENECAIVTYGSPLVQMVSCDTSHPSEKWGFDPAEGQIHNEDTKLCLTVKSAGDGLSLEKCESSPYQLWTIDDLNHRKKKP